jgi:hypothetical protein
MTTRAFQNNGNRQDFLQPVMAFAAGRAQRNERMADEQKNADAKAYMARMDAFEQNKADKALMVQKEADFKKNGIPLITQAYVTAFKSGGQEAASAAGAKAANDYGNANGVGGMPFISQMAMFNDGKGVFQGYEYDAANKKLSDVPTNFMINSTGQAFKAKGKDWVPVENFLNAEDAARMKNAEASQQRADNSGAGAGAKNKEQLYGKMNQWGKFQPVGSFRSQEEAFKAGATHLKTNSYDQDGIQNTQYNELYNPNAAAPRPKLEFDAQHRPIRQGAPAPQGAAPAAQPAPAPAGMQTARMVNPMGKTVMVQGNIQDAIAKGYKLIQ